MFGFGKKDYDVRLSEKELKQLTSNMSKREKKEFERRQREAEGDRMWDMLCMAELFSDDF